MPMMAEPNQRPVYACAEWEIDLARRELRSMGESVPLGGRAFEILAELAQAEGGLVTKNDLTERVWRGVFVEESALRVHIAAIRKAFGSDRDMLATAEHTSLGSGSEANSTSSRSAAKPAGSVLAACSASAVLPSPPGPMRLTTR